MSHVEFDRQATMIAEQIPSLPEGDRIAAACRGSGNPAALSWLAECLRLDESTTVVDLGGGLGGPSEWLRQHFGCHCINVEVSAGAAAAHVFGTPTIRGCAEHAPIRTDGVDVALLFGVLSVASRADVVLDETFRIARRLGLFDYCSTTGTAVRAGGSTFVSAERLSGQVRAAGWHVVQMAAVTVPPPVAWTDASESIDVEPEGTETEVINAIHAGRIVPFVLHATRADKIRPQLAVRSSSS